MKTTCFAGGIQPFTPYTPWKANIIILPPLDTGSIIIYGLAYTCSWCSWFASKTNMLCCWRAGCSLRRWWRGREPAWVPVIEHYPERLKEGTLLTVQRFSTISHPSSCSVAAHWWSVLSSWQRNILSQEKGQFTALLVNVLWSNTRTVTTLEHRETDRLLTIPLWYFGIQQ